ncbi:hypothetical protein DJ013_09965 [Arcticibacterium luteifluviistationis]|uniref:Helix-turn-helix domain-containing protein n=2 Tax=Arcticibacterium luteifluviistationis TaxID=1784714 RepID=A0A2Z4GIK8_9BACT|nr:hypothetical protein DJ013_09965 [Arcticibacterium luteifluviistationis]
MKSNSSKPQSQGSTWLKLEEAAAYLQVPKSTIYQLTHHGKIEFHKLGNRLRFRKEELDDYLVRKSQRVVKNSFIHQKHASKR